MISDIVFYSFLGGEDRTIEFMKREGGSSSRAPLLPDASEKGVIKHPFPMKYFLKPWKLGEWFYLVIKFGIIQYVSQTFVGDQLLLVIDISIVTSILT